MIFFSVYLVLLAVLSLVAAQLCDNRASAAGCRGYFAPALTRQPAAQRLFPDKVVTVRNGDDDVNRNLNGETIRVASFDNQRTEEYMTYLWFNPAGQTGSALSLYVPLVSAGDKFCQESVNDALDCALQVRMCG